MWVDKRREFSELQGKVLRAVEVSGDGEDTIVFRCEDGTAYRLYHAQMCCENVVIESVVGDLTDVVGTPILLAEETSNNEDDNELNTPSSSHTWTFYKLRTIKGSVDIRWHGSSNGYYSEKVDFEIMMEKN